jgi:hypothetical protein
VEKISEFVMNVGHSLHLRNSPACKNKWGSLFGDFKKNYDYMASTGYNKDYGFHYEYTLIHFLLCVGCLAIFFSSLLSLQPCVIDVVDSK